MRSQLLDQATRIVGNPQLLINIISKRVRQLNLGHRPLVEVTSRSEAVDIALKEVIEGKISGQYMGETKE